MTHFLVDHSINQIDAALESDQSFFLWHNDWGPHSPCVVPQRFYDMYKDMDLEP